jgi:hypothetical protein
MSGRRYLVAAASLIAGALLTGLVAFAADSDGSHEATGPLAEPSHTRLMKAEQWVADLMPNSQLAAQITDLGSEFGASGWHVPVMGLLTAALVFSTFYMQTMVRLRFAAIGSNIAFLAYGCIFHLWPSIILHGTLLPLNLWRLLQMRRTLRDIQNARGEKFDIGKLLPFLQLQKYPAGTVLFAQNDVADKAYYIVRGTIALPDIPAEIGESTLFGEVGVFAGSKRRASSAVCSTDAELYTLDEATITTAFYQNPKFALYLVSLIAERLYVSHVSIDPAEAPS